MTNPIPYIRNKFCFWLTGLSLDEIESIKNKVDEQAQEHDYVSKSDFDPDDYDFSPLNDYDFSEFLTIDNVDEQIESFLGNNNYCTADYIEEAVSDYLNDNLEEQVRDLFNNASPAPMSVEDIRKEIEEAIKELSKKKKKKKKKDAPKPE